MGIGVNKLKPAAQKVSPPNGSVCLSWAERPGAYPFDSKMNFWEKERLERESYLELEAQAREWGNP